MSVFNDYSRYYNLLYKDKPYKQEVDFVDKLIRRNYNGVPKSLLDLGCGTGRHDLIFAEVGYDVTGVDMSEQMVSIAKQNSKDALKGAEFQTGDIRSVRLNKQFDVVVSLFHVFCYQVTNEDLRKAFETVKVHLKKGGLFVFDFWYGPAVLTDRPSVRDKKLEDDSISINRNTIPVMHANENVVDVNFTVDIVTKHDNSTSHIRELHRMRYLFIPELLHLASLHGFKVVEYKEWMTGKELDYNTWNGYMVCSMN